MNQIAAASSPLRRRTLGLVYLLYFLAATASALFMKGLLVANDAAATAGSILAHADAYRAGLAADLVANALYIAVTVLLCRLLAPAGRRTALVAAAFGLVGCAVQVFGNTFRLATLVVLQGDDWLAPFNGHQVHAAALLGLKLHAQTFNSSLVLFALFDLLVGCLVVRSTLLPRALGALLVVAGLGWLSFLWPPLAATLSPVVMPLGALAEFALMLWLLVRGVDEDADARGT